MSKIFDALQQARGALSQPLPAPLAEQMAAADAVQAQANETAATLLAKHKDGRTVEEPETPIRVVSVPSDHTSPIFPFDDRHSVAAEQYRMIRTRIVQNVEPHRLILVSSPDAGDGKTVTTINVAGAMALKKSINVLILDADLCRPAVARTLEIPESPGVTEVLQGSAALSDAIVRIEAFPNLYVLPAGKMVENRTELLDSARWTTLCSTLRKQFDFTLVDAPPVNSVADYPLTERSADGVILVVRPDHTNRVRSVHAVHSVPKEKFLGVVMNAVEDWFLLRNNHFYYYGYYNSYYSKNPADKAPESK